MKTNTFIILLFMVFLLCFLTGCEPVDDSEKDEDSGDVDDDEPEGFGDYEDDDSTDDDVDDDVTNPDDDSANDDDQTPGPLECMIEEGFEGATFPPAGWMVERTNPFSYFQWRQSYYTAYSGKYSAMVLAYFLGSDELLITNYVDLSNYSTLSVTFWNFGAYKVYSGNFDPPELSIEVSDDIKNWVPVWSFSDSDWVDMNIFTGDLHDLYTEVTINLDDYMEESIYVGWRFKHPLRANLVTYYWTVDDIKICGNLKE